MLLLATISVDDNTKDVFKSLLEFFSAGNFPNLILFIILVVIVLIFVTIHANKLTSSADDSVRALSNLTDTVNNLIITSTSEKRTQDERDKKYELLFSKADEGLSAINKKMEDLVNKVSDVHSENMATKEILRSIQSNLMKRGE
jgi:Sec-independent protein translocase protein TatA